jgi:DNA-binding transcriptional MerR regulator
MKPGLKMSELADASGVSSATIKHYLREGLLGDDEEIVRTSRNMAYYPAEFVERIRRIKRLQEERFLPLRLIKVLLDEQSGGRVPRAQLAERAAVPEPALDRLEQIGVLTPTAEGYDADDVKIVEAIARFRAGGYDERIGFTVYDTLRYREALQLLVEEEVSVLLERLSGDVEPDAAVEIMRSGREPLRELIGAMHSKLLLAELMRRR